MSESTKLARATEASRLAESVEMLVAGEVHGNDAMEVTDIPMIIMMSGLISLSKFAHIEADVAAEVADRMMAMFIDGAARMGLSIEMSPAFKNRQSRS